MLVASMAGGGTVAVVNDPDGQRALRSDPRVAGGVEDLTSTVSSKAAQTVNSNRVGGISINDNVPTKARDPAGVQKAKAALALAKSFYDGDDLPNEDNPRKKFGDYRFMFDDQGEYRGIDFDKEVKIDKLKKDTVVCQYQVRGGSTGAFFAPCDAKPGELGISDLGRRYKSLGPPGKEVTYKHPVVEAKVQRRFRIVCQDPPEVLISTAAPVDDKWSLGVPVATPGGATQFTVRRSYVGTPAFKNCFQEVR